MRIFNFYCDLNCQFEAF